MKSLNLAGLLVLGIMSLQFSVANAADRSIFKSKKENQHQLTEWESNKMEAEFKSKFSATESGAFQKLNNNPWASKKSKQKNNTQKSQNMVSSWGACREYALVNRQQCYGQGGDAYTCERYYDARVKRCNETF
ncbi:MAG: hypothetical protein OEY89_17130 [Gammaproteobacteria bacterium]|nr:hypothetical protein [Gammaproteobacteria bacterium]